MWTNFVKHYLVIEFLVVKELAVLNTRLVSVVHLSPMSREETYKNTDRERTA